MEKERKTYRVVCKTDLYHASRDAKFNDNGEWCEPDWKHLSLKEANELLFKYFKEDTQYFANWGLAVIWSSHPRCELQDVTCWTNADETRGYDNDIYMWRIEEEYEDER